MSMGAATPSRRLSHDRYCHWRAVVSHRPDYSGRYRVAGNLGDRELRLYDPGDRQARHLGNRLVAGFDLSDQHPCWWRQCTVRALPSMKTPPRHDRETRRDMVWGILILVLTVTVTGIVKIGRASCREGG